MESRGSWWPWSPFSLFFSLSFWIMIWPDPSPLWWFFFLFLFFGTFLLSCFLPFFPIMTLLYFSWPKTTGQGGEGRGYHIVFLLLFFLCFYIISSSHSFLPKKISSSKFACISLSSSQVASLWMDAPLDLHIGNGASPQNLLFVINDSYKKLFISQIFSTCNG